MAVAIGLSSTEVEIADTPVIVGPPIGQSGCVFTSPRGPVGISARLAGESDAKRVFGWPSVLYNEYFCLRGLFANAASYGAIVFGSRVVAAATQAAQPARANSSADPTYQIDVGMTTILTIDANSLVTKTWAATAGHIDGVGVTYPVSGGSKTLSFKVDNGAQIDVALGSGSLTLDAVLALVNPAGLPTDHFAAVDNSGQFRLRSDKLGTGSKIQVLNTTGATLLGITPATGTGTGDAADITQVTAAEVQTAMQGSLGGPFTGLVVNITGLGRIQLQGTVTGVLGQIIVGAGTANTILGLTPATTNGTAATAGGPTPASTTFKRSGVDSLTYTAGYRGHESPGTWANGTVFVQHVVSQADSSQRDILVFELRPGDTKATQVERYNGCTMDNVVSLINSADSGSQLVLVNVEPSNTGMPDANALPVDIGTDNPGNDGAALPTSTDYSNALAAFKGLSVQVIANFDLDNADWASKLETYCAGRGNVVGIFQSLRGANIAATVAEFAPLQKQKSFIAGYRGYATVSDGGAGLIDIPILGHEIGAGFVRAPREAGDKPHTSPAGRKAAFLDISTVKDSTYDQDDLRQLTNGCGVNAIVFEQGGGFFAKTSRTMSTLDKWVSIHVRLLTNFIKVGFENGLFDFEQEGNNEISRRQLKTAQDNFLAGLDDQQAFDKAKNSAPYRTTCDETNNGINIRQQRRMRSTCLFRPVEIAESIELEISQTRDVIAVTEQ